MLVSILFTVLVECLVAVLYASWKKKPRVSLLITTAVLNLLTQILLWVGLHLSFNHAAPTVLVGQVLTWMFESIVLFRVSSNKLSLWEAIALSLVMNLASFGLGWLLPA